MASATSKERTTGGNVGVGRGRYFITLGRRASWLAGLAAILLSLSGECFADKTLPLAGSTCVPPNQVNCIWNDHQGCFIRAASFVNNGTCAPPDSSGRAGVQVTSPDGCTVTTTRCAPSVIVNDFCDTILNPQGTFETVTVNLCTGSGGGGGCGDVGGDGFNPIDGGAGSDGCSPVIVDTGGEGFHLTSAANGVLFDIRGDGHPVQIAWTASGSLNAFLALDRNHNGKIDDGTELFGNFTVQPKSPSPNGFLALAEYDKPENGGNGDGIIDEHDAVFSHLVLWIDENHDGISQPSELHSLPELGVFSISLNYMESRKRDEFGNVFRFKAKINPADRSDQSEVGRWAYDVFLTTK
jgi:hypothetical protein